MMYCKPYSIQYFYFIHLINHILTLLCHSDLENGCVQSYIILLFYLFVAQKRVSENEIL